MEPLKSHHFPVNIPPSFHRTQKDLRTINTLSMPMPGEFLYTLE